MHTILLVDDDLNFRRSLVIQLELEGYSVKAVESANQALELLKQCRSEGRCPDLVITDVRMSGMGGEEFVMKLKQDYPELPVNVISAFDLPVELAGYLFLRKPFKKQEMIDNINKLVKDNSAQ